MQLAECFGGHGILHPVRRRCPTRYRSGATFFNPRDYSRPMDRNQKARLLFALEVLERQTKQRGRRNGDVSLVGLAVARAMLLRFHNSTNGLCFPSIAKLQEVTGFCRATIVMSLKRLERIGVLGIRRRWVRFRQNGIVGVRQGSNVYVFNVENLCPSAGADIQAPLKSLGFFPRVYGVARNYVENKNTSLSCEQETLKREFSMEVSAKSLPKCWRERARLSMLMK